jgi:hypothetical protein
MARINSSGAGWAVQREAIVRAHPPVADAIIRELCERIEHGGKAPVTARSGRRSQPSDVELLTMFTDKKEEYDIEKLKRVLTNVYRQLALHCVGNCEDFGASRPDAFCRKRSCVHKSVLRVLGRILNGEVHFHLTKEKTKVRKRRIEISDD